MYVYYILSLNINGTKSKNYTIILVMKNRIVCMSKYVINVCNTKCILEKNTCDYNIK